MKIIPNQDFKHGKETFLKGTEYDVPDEDGEYFTNVGWVGEKAEPTEQSLDIHDGVLGHESEVN